jgi:hypothetical protein
MKVYISLTSIYDNQTSLLPTLQSIEHQSHQPDKCYIYLSEQPYLLDRGFKDRKLLPDLSNYLSNHDLFEVRWCDNLGPYRKLLLLLREKWNEDCLIITIDDDTVYVPTLIKNYIDDYQRYHCCITYRGFTMSYGSSIREITYEKRGQLINRHLYNFHTGKGGVVYHPQFFNKTKSIMFDQNLYRACSETGDDIWFNFMRIANGVECYVDSAQPYMSSDLTTEHSLYRKFNDHNHLNTTNIQKTIDQLIKMGYLSGKSITFDSSDYWESRYRSRGTSGDGSYGDKAVFKAGVINGLIRQVSTIIDYGVGDGNQLKYFDTTGKHYLGLDVSPTAIAMCRTMFKDDPTKTFCLSGDYNWTRQAELVLSCDVIYHLIDDDIYEQYMQHLFEISCRYVLIHAVDRDFNQASHVKFRHFTPLIAKNYPQWKLVNVIRNHLWVGPAGKMAFYLYKKSLRLVPNEMV